MSTTTRVGKLRHAIKKLKSSKRPSIQKISRRVQRNRSQIQSEMSEPAVFPSTTISKDLNRQEQSSEDEWETDDPWAQLMEPNVEILTDSEADNDDVDQLNSNRLRHSDNLDELDATTQRYSCKTCGYVATTIPKTRRPPRCPECTNTLTETTSPPASETNEPKQTKKAFKCRVCQQAFLRQDRCLAHENRHAEDQPLACDVCRVQLPRNDLLIHLRQVHETTPFKCPCCQFVCSVKGGVASHFAQAHPGKKSFQCPVGECGYWTNVSSNLRQHERIHSGVKPFQCRVCQRAFSDQSAWRKHELVHRVDYCPPVNQRPQLYTCHLCEFTADRPAGLKRHVKLHPGQTLFGCQVCGKKFTKKNSLRVHARSHAEIVADGGSTAVPDGLFRCRATRECNYVSRKLSSFTNHLKKHK